MSDYEQPPRGLLGTFEPAGPSGPAGLGLPGWGGVFERLFLGQGPGPSQRYYDLQEEALALQVVKLRREAGVTECEGTVVDAVFRRAFCAIIVGGLGSGKSETARALVASYAEETGAELVAFRRQPVTKSREAVPVVQRWQDVPEDTVVWVDDPHVLHDERATSKPSPEFSEFLVECRHRRNRVVVVAQSWKQLPSELLTVDMGQVFGCKRTGVLARAFTREEVKPFVDAAAAVMETMPRHQGVTVWWDCDGRLFSTFNLVVP